MRKILCITLLILAAVLSVAAQKPRVHKPRARKQLVQKPLVQKPLVQKPLVQKPLVQIPIVANPIVENQLVENQLVEEAIVEKPIVEIQLVEKPPVENPLVENPLVENPLVENPLVENPLVETPLVQYPFVQYPFGQNPRAQNPLAQDNADPLVSEWQPLGTITPAVDESPGTQFSPDFEGQNDLTGLATYADAQAHSHTNLVTIDVVYSYRSYVMPGNSGDAFLGNVINVQGPNGGLRLWMPFSANASYWVGFICNMEGYVRYRNLRITYDADCGIVTALDYR